VAGAALLGILGTLSVIDQVLIDYLWYGSLGFSGLFRTTIAAQTLIFACVWLFVAGAVATSAMFALANSRERLRVVRRTGEIVELNLPELMRAFGERIPWRTIVLIVSAIVALVVAQGEAASWDVFLKGFFGVPFGKADPAFGNDIGFYVFRVPMLEELRDLAMTVTVIAAIAAFAVYWARGAIDFRESPPHVSTAAASHLSVLLAIFFVLRAFSYYLARYDLLLHSNGVVFGLRYVDTILWQPGLWLLAIMSIVAAAISLSNVGRGGFSRLALAAVVMIGPSILLNLAQPAIERLWVKPDELRVEKPFIERNIEATRQAYKLSSVDVRPFAGKNDLTPAALTTESPTVDNIRLWDPRPLIDTYRQLQEIRTYYDFRDVDIDRYVINGKYTEVMLAARELNISSVAESAQTWVNQHLKFTHGAGLAMSPVNTMDSEGMPIFYIKNIPAKSDVGIKVDQPAIYYGEEPDNYAVVNSATPEFDYPRGADNVFGYYAGSGGVPIHGLLRRILFSFFFRDINLLVTENIVPKSKIMFRRNIKGRIAYLAPFLALDHDPYAVVHDGHLVWMVDAYTASDRYPYSQRNADGINYIRNSVKVVVDAYTGATDFYVADADDPIIRTWQRIFPAMFKPMSAMPRDLRGHIRYPEDFFLLQADIYRTYHMTDPQVFYNREDNWSFPRENYGGDTIQMQPYYVIMRLPDEPHEEYMLMLPMVPSGRDNMIAWLAARCDGVDYGHLFEYEFSKDRLFYGPYQIQARINQNPDISRQLSLWNQMGSKVLLGNLLVIPIRNSLLYVEPLYIRAENGQLPELQRVIASYSDRVVMGETLASALAALFSGTPSAPASPVVVSAISNPAPAPAAAPKIDFGSATSHYNRALQALKAGDWVQFGAEMQKLGGDLGQPQSPVHQ
jgi:hypothetical protein